MKKKKKTTQNKKKSCEIGQTYPPNLRVVYLKCYILEKLNQNTDDFFRSYCSMS